MTSVDLVVFAFKTDPGQLKFGSVDFTKIPFIVFIRIDS